MIEIDPDSTLTIVEKSKQKAMIERVFGKGLGTVVAIEGHALSIVDPSDADEKLESHPALPGTRFRAVGRGQHRLQGPPDGPGREP